MIFYPPLHVASAYKACRKTFSEMTINDKFWFLFWLAGPFIYLIERTPADIWLSFIGIAFLAKCWRSIGWSWTNQLWVKLTVIFWLICLVSAIASPLPAKAFGEAIVWARFPLYACAAQIWLGVNRANRILMLTSITIAMLIMTGILTAESIIDPKSRLSWPYGDLTPGNFLAKATLPAFTTLAAIAMSGAGLFRISIAAILLYSFGVSILAGERINMLIRLCSGFLAGLSWRPNLALFGAATALICLLIAGLFITNENVSYRLGSYFLSQNPIHLDTSPYWAVWRAGVLGFADAPLLGQGPGNLRYLCDSLPEVNLPGYTDCDNHPHHFYFQLAGETGLIGLMAGLIMMVSIGHACWQARQHMPECPMAATAFIMPLAFFWPIQATADFFGQWNNLFMWMALGFAIMQNQRWHPKS